VSVGAILQASAFSLPHFIVGRIICGMGTGINTATVPVWQAECIKPHLRGPVMAFEVSLIIAGVMISYWIDFGFSYAEPNSVAWRFPIAFQLVFSLFILITVMGLPESPRWLMLRNKHEEANATLCTLYDLPHDDTYIVEEMNSIKASLLLAKNVSFFEAFKNGPLRNGTRTAIALSIQILSQLTGINIITYYAATIYENEIGLSPFLSRILAACNGTQYFIASMFSPLLIKHFNRRSLLMFASAGLATSMAILAVMNAIGGKGPGIVAAIFLFVFNTFFGIAWAQISWIYPAEIVPLATRAPINALSTSSNWIFNFMVVMVTPVAFANIHWRTYIIFAVFNASAIPIIYAFYPETRGRSLEEVDIIFSESKNIFDAVKNSKTMERHYDDKGNLTKSVAQDVENSMVIHDLTPKGGGIDHIEARGTA
jgi:sugar porter (SP) family MFS transporter